VPRRALWLLAGALPVAAITLTHHALVYGDPFRVGYTALAVERMAHDARIGFVGFDGFLALASPGSSTFGVSRGFFFLCPFLLAALPGFVRLWRASREEALVIRWLRGAHPRLIASLVYWHSGSAVGSATPCRSWCSRRSAWRR